MGELEISKIEEVLDERVRPNLAQHGGDSCENAWTVQRMSFRRADLGKSGQHRVKRSVSGTARCCAGDRCQ